MWRMEDACACIRHTNTTKEVYGISYLPHKNRINSHEGRNPIAEYMISNKKMRVIENLTVAYA